MSKLKENEDEISFGVVPVVKGKPDMFLLIQSRDGHWGFPKGHQHDGETDVQTALRELKEETNIALSENDLITESVLTEEYRYQKDGKDIPKQVIYFVGFVGTIPEFRKSDEITDRAVLAFDNALSRLTYDESKNILRMAIRLADNLS